MSVDLFVQKEGGVITPEELDLACTKISKLYPDIVFDNKSGGVSFWKANKCDFTVSETGEVIVSSNSTFYNFVEFIAVSLIRQGLGTKIFDPQEGSYLNVDLSKVTFDLLKQEHESSLVKSGAQLRIVARSNPTDDWTLKLTEPEIASKGKSLMHKFVLDNPEIDPKSLIIDIAETGNFGARLKIPNAKSILVSRQGKAGKYPSRGTIAVSSSLDNKDLVNQLVEKFSLEFGAKFETSEEY
jgi:hypothetical protein